MWQSLEETRHPTPLPIALLYPGDSPRIQEKALRNSAVQHSSPYLTLQLLNRMVHGTFFCGIPIRIWNVLVLCGTQFGKC